MKKIISALLFFLLLISFSSHATTRNVCASGATYTTITAALAPTAAANGDEIVICPGTYNESLSFSQSNLTIRSSTGNRSDVKINNSATVFTIGGRNATIKNLTITVTGNNAAIANDYNNGIGTHTFENLAITAKGTGIYLQTGGPHTFRQLDITSSAGSGISTAYNSDAAHVFDTVTVNSQDVGIAVIRGAASMKNVTVTSSNDIGISLSSKYSTIFQTVKISAKKDGLVITTQDGSDPQTLQTFIDITASSQNGTAINLQRGIASMMRVKVNGGDAGIVLYGASSLQDIDTSAKKIALNIGSQSAANLTGVVANSTSDTAILFDDTGGSEYTYNLKNITITGAGADGIKVEKSARVNADNICVQSAAGNGVRFDYNAKKVTLINSILKGHGNYGVSVLSNPESISHVNNSCFYKAPCAEGAWSPSVRDFSGNFTAPANCNNGADVIFSNPLQTCPFVENQCYVAIPPGTTAAGSFNAFESQTASGAIAGVIKTKIAGNPITLDVVALNASRDAIVTNFVGNVGVELVEGTANCATSPVLSGTTVSAMTFAATSNGRQTVTLPAVANVYRDVRVRISYTATSPITVACSTDNFAIRPDKFIRVSATDNNWQTAGVTRALANNAIAGGNVHKAGQPFTLSATAVSATAAQTTTSNYSGSPLATIACTLPTPTCVNGTLTAMPTTWSGSGTTTTSEATYSEVGSFNLTLMDQTFANVDIKPGDSTVDEYTISSAPVLVGRFVPNHFVLATSNTPVFQTFDSECIAARSFTYIGQPFKYETLPVALITAKNAAGGTTSNYRGTLWNLSGANANVTPTYNTPVSPGAINPATVVADTAWPGTGSLTINAADELKFLRNPTTPQVPFNANISLSVTVTESVPGHGDILSTTSAVFNGGGNGIAFDKGNEFRYGRLRVENANGSELLNLSVPIRADYWNGTNFVTNAADNCTSIAAANVALRAYAGGITAGNMPASRVIGGDTLKQGIGHIVLARPAPAPLTKGSVDLCVDLGPDTSPPAGIACAAIPASKAWLQGKWSETLYDDDPSGRATFGTYKSGPVIYMREVY